MADFTGLPRFPSRQLRITRVSVDVIGSAIDGGRNTFGQSVSMEISGGGLVTIAYDISLGNFGDMEAHQILNWLGARLNGGYRFINVPILNKGIAPLPLIAGERTDYVPTIPTSDGALFTTAGGYRTPTVWGEIRQNAALNAGTVKMKLYNAGQDLKWSGWFSIKHLTKGWRAYRFWQVISKSDADNPVYELAIEPPLREAISDGDRVEWVDPMCVCKFPSDFTLPSEREGWYEYQSTIQFVEAF